MNRERIEKHIKDIIDSETGFIDERETVKEITAGDIDKITQQIFDNIIKQHEQDTLKEFVKWLKDKYTKSEKEQYEIYAVYAKEDDRLKSNFHDGCRFGFELAKTSLDQDLENFIKERDK